MTRHLSLGTINSELMTEMDALRAEHRAGRVPDLLKASDEVHKRYHEKIWALSVIPGEEIVSNGNNLCESES